MCGYLEKSGRYVKICFVFWYVVFEDLGVVELFFFVWGFEI